MKYKIMYSANARNDLRTVSSYVELEFGRKTERKVMTSIIHSIDLLSDFPYRGPRLSSYSPFGDSLKIFPDKYRLLFNGMNVIFYSVDEELSEVHILDVYDKRESITARITAYFKDNETN